MNTQDVNVIVVSKQLIRKGSSLERPAERAICSLHVKLRNIGIDNELSIKEIKKGLYSEIIEEDDDKVHKIGEACSKIDIEMEKFISTMSVNEQSVITLDVSAIGENNTFVKSGKRFSIELTLQNVIFHKRLWKWSPEEKHDIAFEYKNKGVELFKAKRHVDAFYKFSKACKILITLEPKIEDSPMRESVSNLRCVLYNNMAECQLIKKNYEHVITLCNKVLSMEHNNNNIKALYRRGVAHGSLRDYERAVSDLKIVTNIEPQNLKAHEKCKIYNEQLQVNFEGYKDMVRKMFIK